MKAICIVCGKIGVLQQRGNSRRIQHYIGFESGKRIYQYHKMEVVEVMEVKTVEVKNRDLSPKGRELVRRVGFEPTNPYGIGASGLRL